MSRSRAVAALVALAALTASTAGTAARSSRCADPAPPTPLSARLARALVAPGLDLCRTSALAVDLRTGEVVYAHRASLALAPASNEKLPVAYAALARLGPRYQFRTDALAHGLVDGPVLHGDLVLRGYGDPTLDADDIDRLAAQVKRVGLRRVTGRVLGDESWFDRRRMPSGWAPSFVGDESPPLSALVVDRGHGWPALSTALLAAKALTAALRRRGIAVSGRPGLGRSPHDAVPLAEDLSEPLAAILRTMNRESDNFVAEMLLKTLGAETGEGGTTAAGASITRAVLAEALVPLAGARLADGSGLSRLDRLSAASLVAILRLGAEGPGHDAFLSSLAVAGVAGTLERRLDRRPAYGQVIGKTGTTRFASSLSGFVRGKFAFAVLQNGDPVPWWTARATQDAFALALARAP